MAPKIRIDAQPCDGSDGSEISPNHAGRATAHPATMGTIKQMKAIVLTWISYSLMVNELLMASGGVAAAVHVCRVLNVLCSARPVNYKSSELGQLWSLTVVNRALDGAPNCGMRHSEPHDDPPARMSPMLYTGHARPHLGARTPPPLIHCSAGCCNHSAAAIEANRWADKIAIRDFYRKAVCTRDWCGHATGLLGLLAEISGSLWAAP